MIKKIYLLVHPTFHSLTEDPLMELHIREEELREAWAEVARKASLDEEAIFFEFRTEVRDYAYLRQTQPANSFDTIKKKYDMEKNREEHFRRILRDRYIVYPGSIMPKNLDFLKIFDEHDLDLDDNIELIAFGEYAENCVQLWSEDFQKQLEKIGIEVHRRIDAELSLSPTDSIIRDDRAEHGAGVSKYW